jgi:hypothetical protein
MTGHGRDGGDAPWLFVAEVERPLEMLVDDTCVVELRRGEDSDVLRLRNSEFHERDAEHVLPAAPGSDHDAALVAVAGACDEGVLTIDAVHKIGLLTEAELLTLSRLATARQRGARQRAQRTAWAAEKFPPHAIVSAASELGLWPEPDTEFDQRWWANCPVTHHRLALQPAADYFFCGYCRRSGGPAELRAFCAERRAPSRVPRSD